MAKADKPTTTPEKAKAAKPKAPSALQQPLTPSKDLAAIVGAGTLTRGEVVSKVWAYIKSNKLQRPRNHRRRKTEKDFRQALGYHVRNEQAPRPAPQLILARTKPLPPKRERQWPPETRPCQATTASSFRAP